MYTFRRLCQALIGRKHYLARGAAGSDIMLAAHGGISIFSDLHSLGFRVNVSSPDADEEFL